MTDSALGANIKTKGQNSYYYAHAGTNVRSEQELQLILDDINQLEAYSETSYSKRLLQREKASIEEELKKSQLQAKLEQQRAEQQKKFQEQAVTKGPPAPPTATGDSKYTQVVSYAWDQSDKFVSVYIPCEGVGKEPKENVKCTFGLASFHITMDLDAAGGKGASKHQQMKVPNLCKHIDTAKSKILVKADRLVVKLKKKELGLEWSGLDDTTDRKKAERDKRVKSGDLKEATTQQLLADMYADADDETRRGLMEAAAKGQMKRDARAQDIKKGNKPKPIQAYGDGDGEDA